MYDDPNENKGSSSLKTFAGALVAAACGALMTILLLIPRLEEAKAQASATPQAAEPSASSPEQLRVESLNKGVGSYGYISVVTDPKTGREYLVCTSCTMVPTGEYPK